MLIGIRYFLCLFVTALALISCSSEAEFGGAGAKSYDQVASRVFNFRSSKIIPQTMTLSDGGRFTSIDLTQRERAPSQVLQRQVKRQSFSEKFVQGHPARFSEEEFELSEAGLLDFLVVVDNSRSMSDERDMVARGLAPLISSFSDINWQIAVISMSNPCIGTSNLIRKTDLNPAAKFAEAVRQSVDWQATEQGFPMAIRALRGQCNNSTRPWLRDGSSVGILFVSDEDNCGSDSGEQRRCANLEGKNADEMVAALRVIRPAEYGRMYAIIDKDGTCPEAGGIGSMYVEALAKTGGTAGSICRDYSSSNGYGEYLSGVSSDVSRIIKRQFKLSSIPDMTQFEVYVDGQVSNGGIVSINGKTVTIDPAAFTHGTKIKFSYSHDAVPMFSQVPVAVTPSLETISVTVNGRSLQQTSDYSYNAVAKTIDFSEMPPADANIHVSYLEDRALQTVFSLDMTGARADTVQVLVNGVLQGSQQYSFDDAGVYFLSPPTDGAVVSIAWRTEAHKVRDYSVSISDPRQPVDWQVIDKTTGINVPATWDGAILSFDHVNVIEGRIVALSIDFGEKSQIRSLKLPTERIDEELIILADGRHNVCFEAVPPDPNSESWTSSLNGKSELEEQKNKNWKARYKGKSITLQCQSGVDYSVLEIKYLHEVERINSFAVLLPLEINPDDSMIGWRVYINGAPTKNFKRDGSVVTLHSDELPPDTRVDIEVLTYTAVGE
jgi:hypothetical protein